MLQTVRHVTAFLWIDIPVTVANACSCILIRVFAHFRAAMCSGDNRSR
jgi:hypothetical protein